MKYTWNHWKRIDEKTVKLVGSGTLVLDKLGHKVLFRPFSPTIKQGDWVTMNLNNAFVYCDIPAEVGK